MSTKAGARHSNADQKLIQAAHDAITQAGASCGDMSASKAMALDEQVNAVRDAIYSALETNRAYDSGLPYPYIEAVYDDYVIVKIGIACYQVSYTLADTGVAFADPSTWTLVEQNWTAKGRGAKAGAVASQSTHRHATVKAVEDGGEWTLDILAAPFGSATNKDAHNEYFSASTKFHEDKFALPPLVYYHGYDPTSNTPAGEPEFLGKTIKRWTDSAGVWYKAVLDKASAAAAKVWASAKRGGAVASSGSMSHLTRYGRDGQILHWPITELSVWDGDTTGRKPANTYAVALPAAKALYARLNQAVPDLTIAEPTGDPQVTGDVTATAAATAATTQPATKGRTRMDEEQIKAMVAAAIQADRETQASAQAEAAKRQSEVDEAVKAERVKWEADAAKARRLPYGENGNEAPGQTQFAELKKYDDLNAGEQAILIGLLDSTANRRQYRGASENAYKALAIKTYEDKTAIGDIGRRALKAAGFNPEDAVKANEVMYATQSGFGDEWVPTVYGSSMWEVIRVNTWVLDKIPTKELTGPGDTWIDPLEGADPTWYKIGETTADNATTGTPNATVTDSKFATANKTLTVGKAGARIEYSGELDEDSLIAIAPEIRRKFGVSGAEMLESLVIDGDTATGATTNINLIDGTPGGTEYYLVLNGFRKSCLVTTTANSRSAGGAFASSDFLETVKLMGTAGINALDKSKVSFIVDPLTNYKALTLIDVKTRDINSNATIESGMLTNIYGYQVMTSAQMAKLSPANRLTNSAGKVDQGTAANDLYGSLLAVRWDQWKLGWKRRMTIESLRIARADITEFTALMRVGLMQRDTEASAVTYKVGV